MSTEKENDMNVSNSGENVDELTAKENSKQSENVVASEASNNAVSEAPNDSIEEGGASKSNDTVDAEQSYIMSDNDDTTDDEDDSPDCPEIQKFTESDEDVRTHLELYSKELLLVDETPEERKEIDAHPERPILTMRNTSSMSSSSFN